MRLLHIILSNNYYLLAKLTTTTNNNHGFQKMRAIHALQRRDGPMADCGHDLFDPCCHVVRVREGA